MKHSAYKPTVRAISYMNTYSNTGGIYFHTGRRSIAGGGRGGGKRINIDNVPAVE